MVGQSVEHETQGTSYFTEYGSYTVFPFCRAARGEMMNTFPRQVKYQVAIIINHEAVYMPFCFGNYARAMRAAQKMALRNKGKVYWIGIEKENSLCEGIVSIAS